jgi:hypothetical protein
MTVISQDVQVIINADEETEGRQNQVDSDYRPIVSSSCGQQLQLFNT